MWCPTWGVTKEDCRAYKNPKGTESEPGSEVGEEEWSRENLAADFPESPGFAQLPAELPNPTTPQARELMAEMHKEAIERSLVDLDEVKQGVQRN